jgi:hypothetical protein
MSLKSLLFFFIFFLPLIVFPQLVNKEINPMNVLFIGNSYTHYNSMPFIKQILDSIYIRNSCTNGSYIYTNEMVKFYRQNHNL